jgi:DNA-binding transcriptional regulator YdaS (Cro superfamily)
MSSEPLANAVEILGGQAALARAIGKRQQHVYNWLRKPSSLPETVAIEIERLTERKVTVEQLLPDVPWHVIRGTPSDPAEQEDSAA